jgi:hypothetical protein
LWKLKTCSLTFHLLNELSGARLEATRSLQDAIEKTNLKLKSNAAEFHTTCDGDETALKDPAIIASDVAAQTVIPRHPRKLARQPWYNIY